MMNKLVIIRGLPGSGKSTMAKALDGFKHFEADMYFMENGEYKFDASKLKNAHDWCYNAVGEALCAGHNVVVSNTFTRKWEMEPYMMLGFPTEMIVANGNYENVHGVSDEAIERMRQRWEE